MKRSRLGWYLSLIFSSLCKPSSGLYDCFLNQWIFKNLPKVTIILVGMEQSSNYCWTALNHSNVYKFVPHFQCHLKTTHCAVIHVILLGMISQYCYSLILSRFCKCLFSKGLYTCLVASGFLWKSLGFLNLAQLFSTNISHNKI
jgi:uncharacterized membrane protein